LTDDEEALKDEEEEAQRLQRQAAEQLQPEDFEQEEDGLEASSSSNEEAETMGAKARQVHKGFLHVTSASDTSNLSGILTGTMQCTMWPFLPLTFDARPAPSYSLPVCPQAYGFIES
jgi:hypothetical protein